LTHYFFESSALAKLFIAELGSDRMIDLVDPLSQPQKLVSSLGFVEVHSAIRRRERAGDLTPAHAAQALTSLVTEIAQMTEQTINSSVIEAARQMLDRHTLRALDSIQLASCWVGRLTSGITDIVFVASDQVLLDAAAAEGFQILNPENTP
jgi:predicted nucleic acid-binding protein